MAIALVGSAAVPTGNPTTSFTVTIPSATATNDVLFLAVTSRGSTGAGTLAVTDNDTGGNTWTLITPVISSYKQTIWWKRATSGTASKTITVSNAVGSAAGVLKAFSGVFGTGSPYSDFSTASNSPGSEGKLGFTPSQDDSMICAAVTNWDDDNAVTSLTFATAGATTMTEKLSTGGSDCAMAFGHVLQAGTATATGNLSWAQVDGNTICVTWTIIPALTPVSLTPAEAPVVLAGTAAIVALGLSVAAGGILFDGPPPTVTVGGPPSGLTIDVPVGALVLGGPTAVRRPDLSLTGYAPDVTIGGAGNTVLEPSLDTLLLVGQMPHLRIGLAASPDTGALILTGQAPAVPLVVTALPFSDDFNDASQDEGKWSKRAADPANTDPLVTVVETTVLTITPRALVSGNHDNGYTTVAVFDLTGASVTVEVPTVPNIAVTGPFAGLTLQFDDSDLSKLASISAAEGPGLYFTYNGGVNSVTYNATNHRWWRIRHSPGSDTLYWETSPDNATWTEQRSDARVDPITQTRATLQAGTYASTAAPGTAIFDNFNAALAAGAVSPAAGALTLAGQAPTLIFGSAFTPAAGALILQGQTPILSVGLVTSPAAGTLVLQGQAPSASSGLRYDPAPGTLTLTGQAPSLGLTVGVSAGTLTFTGEMPDSSVGTLPSPDAGALVLAGQAPVSSLGTVPSPAPGTLVLAGQTPVRIDGIVRSPDAGTLVLTGQQLAANSSIAVPSGALILVGHAPSLPVTGAITPDTGFLVLQGQAPTLNRTYQGAPAQGVLVLSGQTPTRIEGTVRSPTQGALVLAGQAPSARLDIRFSPAQGTLVLSGQAPAWSMGFPRFPAAGSLVLAGQTPLRIDGTVRAPDAGTLVLSGQTPLAKIGLQISPAAGTLVLTGQAPLVLSGFVLPISAGNLTLAGFAPTLTLTANTVSTPDAGGLVLAGYAPTLSVSGGNIIISPDDGILVLSGPAPIVIITAPLPPPTAVVHAIRRVRRLPHLSAELVRQVFSRFQLDVEAGVGLTTGQGSDPQVCLRWSDDGGYTWSNDHWVGAGELGQYGRRAVWRRLGQSRDRVFEVSVSDPVPWRLLDAYVQASLGSR